MFRRPRWRLAFIGLGALLLLCLSAAAASGRPAAASGWSEAAELGQWNGVVSFQTVSNYGSAGTTVVGHDSRVYNVHGETAHMTGSADYQATSDNDCGQLLQGWSWATSGDTSFSSTVDDTTIGFSSGVVDAVYSHRLKGSYNFPLCDPAPAEPPNRGATGSGQLIWHKAGKRSGLLRTTGSITVSVGTGGGSPNPFASAGSLSAPAVVTVQWNLTRRGTDKDRDGLVDSKDPNPKTGDTDGDGYPDGWERDHGTDPTKKSSHPDDPWQAGSPDSDGDGASDPIELQKDTDPHDKTSRPPGTNDTATIDPGKTPRPPKPRPPKRGGGGGTLDFTQRPTDYFCTVAVPASMRSQSSVVVTNVSVLCQHPRNPAVTAPSFYALLQIQQKLSGHWQTLPQAAPDKYSFDFAPYGLVPLSYATPCKPGTAGIYRTHVLVFIFGHIRKVDYTSPPKSITCAN